MRKYFWVGFAARKFRKLCRPDLDYDELDNDDESIAS